MIAKIILIIVALIGPFIAFKFKGLFHKVISLGMTVSALIHLTNLSYSTKVSAVILIVMIFATLLYAYVDNDLIGLPKTALKMMAYILSISVVFQVFHLPFGIVIRWCLIIPIILTIITFVKDKKLTKEMSFMIYWLFFAIIEILRF